ncbi:MAG: tyrosine--tRNA ligase, partial [Arcobacteraceae bacterium]|nr:tyrosine--tRNA ligase [Arcobacteraceae bacterium]
QKFNLLMGRTLQKAYNCNKQQAVLMMPILQGLDGVQKMSKSLGNYIGVTDNANDMFGKVLSISDDLMWRYYELLSTRTLQEIENLKQGVQNGTIHPKHVKDDLAIELVDRYHGKGAGQTACEEFKKIFAHKEIPSNIEAYEVENNSWICQVLVDTGIESSTSQARRDILAGAVKINQEKITDEKMNLTQGEYILQKGKKSFAKVIVKGND